MRMGVAIALGLLMWAAGAAAQVAPATDAVAVERARIGSERERIAHQFALEERACHQRFAVNDCLNRNLVWKRAALAELRRQEIAVNDAERQRRARERLDSLEDKQQSRDADAAARPVEPPRQPRSVQSTAPSPRGAPPQAGAPASRVADPAAVQQHQDRMERKQRRHDEAVAERERQAIERQREADQQAEKVRDAQARKAKILERNAAEPNKAQPLPAP